MWSMVAQRLIQITPPAFPPDKLRQRVEAAWSAVPQEHIQSLFESMPRRVAAVVSTTLATDSELYQSYKESDILNFIKIQRIKWPSHIVRMNEDRTTKKFFNAQPIGTRRKGRPNLRRIDGLEKDLVVLRTRT
ncbi:uncharacterized protein TNCV_1908141 [Trichonephila clavipes]|nr:uncharacterized protein TNCV_1908141 [Trichonephila clavipes]